MIKINMLNEDPAYRVRDCLVLSRPVRYRQGLTWLRLEVRTSTRVEVEFRPMARKVYPFTYAAAVIPPWRKR